MNRQQAWEHIKKHDPEFAKHILELRKVFGSIKLIGYSYAQ
jgi:hypothetical protein